MKETPKPTKWVEIWNPRLTTRQAGSDIVDKYVRRFSDLAELFRGLSGLAVDREIKDR